MSEPSLAPQPSCALARECPISRKPCPGECVFAKVMHAASLGIILFDTAEKAVLFQNAEATGLLAGVVASGDYEGLCALLLAPLPENWIPPFTPSPLRIGVKLLGYTVYGGGRFVWLFIRDISDKARLEAVAEAVELTNNIGYVFSTVRHELGNPVNSVKTALSVLLANPGRFPQTTMLEYIERCLTELSRMEELLGSLKSFSMYEDFQIRTMGVSSFLQKVASLVAPELEEKGVLLSLAVDPMAHEARFDPRALQQVLLNLVANAADAVEGRDSPEVCLRSVALPGLLCIQVQDNGIGMTETQKRDLFKPFVTTKANGTGLGLVIAKKMMARMSGTIEVESAPGIGTNVVLTLPGVGRGPG